MPARWLQFNSRGRQIASHKKRKSQEAFHPKGLKPRQKYSAAALLCSVLFYLFSSFTLKILAKIGAKIFGERLITIFIKQSFPLVRICRRLRLIVGYAVEGHFVKSRRGRWQFILQPFNLRYLRCNAAQILYLPKVLTKAAAFGKIK